MSEACKHKSGCLVGTKFEDDGTMTMTMECDCGARFDFHGCYPKSYTVLDEEKKPEPDWCNGKDRTCNNSLCKICKRPFTFNGVVARELVDSAEFTEVSAEEVNLAAWLAEISERD